MNIKLGARVRDKVTRFTGVVAQRVENLNGCVQFTGAHLWIRTASSGSATASTHRTWRFWRPILCRIERPRQAARRRSPHAAYEWNGRSIQARPFAWM